ncbi:MAG: CARDB domain-containing protein [Dehalococcoidia bacterium]
MKMLKRALPVASILAVLLSLLSPATPVSADSSHTWDSKADFDAGVLIQVNTSSSPGDVVLATYLNTGTGAFDAGDISDTYTTDWRKGAVTQRSNAGNNIVYVDTPAGRFFVGDEVLIIQMTGTGAGNWETQIVQAVNPGQLELTANLSNTYYKDGNSKSQVIMVPQFREMDVLNGGVVTCDPWDGSTGGIVFFRSNSTVTVEPGGRIDVSGMGLLGGPGGDGGGGGKGGDPGSGASIYKDGHDGDVSGLGGRGGTAVCCCGRGGDGALQGHRGDGGSHGSTGQGIGGGTSNHGGTNGSSNDLSLLQAGGGGGGGSGGRGGYGGGGGGGGGGGDIGDGTDGTAGAKGGAGGSGGRGGHAAGAIIIFARAIVVKGNITANGWTGHTGGSGSSGHNSHPDDTDHSEGGEGSYVCSGSAGGGGGGSQGGYGGNGGSGGSGGTIWLAADNLTLGNTLVEADGGPGENGGHGGGPGHGQEGNVGGDMAGVWCEGNDSDDGPRGPHGPSGETGGEGGPGVIRLDYITMSGTTDPLPSYLSGLYYTSGTIASDVWDTGWHTDVWRNLSWQETLHRNTDIGFEVRASDTLFNKNDATPTWIPVGSSSPVTSGLPTGQYMQWRATLTSDHDFTPVLHSVSVEYGDAPIVTTQPATNITATSATLRGNLVFLGAHSTDADVNFQMSDTPGGPYHDVCAAQYLSAPGDFHMDIAGFSPGTTYYYRSKAVSDYDGTSYGNEVSFRTSTMPPAVTTNAAGSVTTSSAVLNGALLSLGSAATVNAYFQWGTTQGGPYHNTTAAQAMTAAGPYDYSLSGLSPDTTYYFRAVADGGIDGTAYGVEMSFTTAKIPPSVTTGAATSITAGSATLNGDLAKLGTATTVNVSFQWGTTPGGPYPNSTTPQARTSAGSFSAGLAGLSGKTTYYFRAMADGGIHGTSYGAERSFTTAIVQPSVDTLGATSITSSSALLNGNLTSLGTASTVDVTFCYGLHPGEFNHLAWQTLSAPADFQATLDGLAPDTTYYFRATAEGDGSSVDGAELTFHTSKTPPSVSTNEATDVTDSSATLNGTLHSLGSAPTVNVSFQYGTTSGMYSNETPAQALGAPSDFDSDHDLAGLSPGTTYYYRAKANGGVHGIAYGTEHVFTTGHTPPSVTTGAASNLTTNSATLNGNLTATGTAATVNVSFQYGTTQGGPYPDSTTPQPKTATGAFHSNLTGLTPYTVYYYRARGDGGASGTGYGDEGSFRTGMFPPYVETLPATDTTGITSKLNGNLRNLGSANTVNVYFEYGTTQGGPYPDSTTPRAKSTTGTFAADLDGLIPGVTYYYVAKGDGGSYGVGTGAEMAFTTSRQPPSVTTDAAGGISADSATLNGNLTNLGSAPTDNVSFQWGTWQGGPYLYSTPQQAKAATGPFQAGLTGLHGDTTYYYRAKADGGIYGAAYGEEQSFTTLNVPPSVETDNATAVGATSARLNGFLDSTGTAPSVETWFEYGTTPGLYTSSTAHETMDSRGFLQAAVSGLTPLTTYYYIAVADGGAHGTDQGDECSFTTGATPPSVSTGGATAVGDDSATLNGDLHSLGTAATVNVSFQYGTTSGRYGNETPLQLMNDPGPFNANLVGLHSHTTYYYRAKADGGEHGISYGTEHSFTTNADPPSVTTDAATHMTTDTARLNGDLTGLGTATTVNASFIYGTTAGGPYPNSTTPQAMTAIGGFHSYLTGLSPFTTYYFKAKADGGAYGTSYGAEDHFTTNRLHPIVETGGAIDVMTNAAILTGDLYLMGSASTVNVLFECGTAPGTYTWETLPQPMTTPDAFHAQLLGLTPDTTYYFRAKGDGGEHGIGYGQEMAFTTGAHPPIVATVDAANIDADSAMLSGDLLDPGSARTVNVRFEYGTRQGGPYFNATAPQAMSAAGDFQAAVTGLSPLTVYYYRSRADGGIYGTGFGAEKSFITPSEPPTVTTEGASSVTTSSATLNGNLTSPGRADTVDVSFLWGTTSGGPYTNTTAPQAMTSAGVFSAGLTGLSSGTTYYFVAQANGGIFGTAYGVERSFTTATIPPPAPGSPPHQGSSGGMTSSTIPPILPVSLPNVVVQSASLSAGRVAPGDPVEITATVANRGTVNGNTVIKLYVNGHETSVRSVTLESGKSRKIVFTTVQNQPGTYTVYVNGVQAGSFVVNEYIDPDIVLFISMALILCSLMMGVVYVWRRRQQVY